MKKQKKLKIGDTVVLTGKARKQIKEIFIKEKYKISSLKGKINKVNYLGLGEIDYYFYNIVLFDNFGGGTFLVERVPRNGLRLIESAPNHPLTSIFK